MSHPSYRDRYLPAMTRAAIEALPDRARSIVIIPTASIEQHGPHLPVGVDSILGQGWLYAALPQLSKRLPVYVGPAVTFGMSDEHLGFPGTITIPPRTFHRILLAAAQQVKAWGFGTLAILNTHGGNTAAVIATLREIQATLGLNACMLAPTWKPPVSRQEAIFGFHAGQVETAWMLALAPHLVSMPDAVCEFPAQLDDPGELRPEAAALTTSWLTADISRSGVMGDATAARAEDGRAWFDAGARSLAEQIARLAAAVRRAPAPLP